MANITIFGDCGANVTISDNTLSCSGFGTPSGYVGCFSTDYATWSPATGGGAWTDVTIDVY
jgi:hypothetical protein